MLLSAPVNPMVGNMGGSAPMSQYPQTPTVATGSDVSVGVSGHIIDGTPMRVVSFMALAIFGLVALRWAGWKFNVTVGG